MLAHLQYMDRIDTRDQKKLNPYQSLYLNYEIT